MIPIMPLVALGMISTLATAGPVTDHAAPPPYDHQPSNTTITTTPADTSSETLPGLAIFFSLAGLAFNAALQRSGADEFPYEGSLSPARVSPFICAADVLVATATILSGLMGGMTLRKSCALYVCHTRLHLAGSPTAPGRSGRNRKRLDIIGFGFAVLGSLGLIVAKNLDKRIVVYAAMYISSLLLYAVMCIAATDVRTQQEVEQFRDSDAGKTLLHLSDMIWCTAYLLQFSLWVQVFQGFASHPRLAKDDGKWMNAGIGGSIALAILLSSFCNVRMYQYWSLRNWRRRHWVKALTVGFVLSIVLGLPDDAAALARWRQIVFIPLGAFSVVVNMLWLVALVMDIKAFLTGISRPGLDLVLLAMNPELKTQVPLCLQERLNPLLSTAPTYWRQTVVLNFCCCQVFYAALNYVFLHDDPDVSLPSWISKISG